MPIYAYRCTSCGHAKDALQKISDPLLTDCPACGATTFVKQVTAAGFQLKGSGWYVTDFRGGNTAAAKPEGEAGDKTPGEKTEKGEKAEKGDKSAEATAANGDKPASSAANAPAPAAGPASVAPAPPAAPAAPAPSTASPPSSGG